MRIAVSRFGVGLVLVALVAGLAAAEPMKPNGLVILFTDYGTDSLYVGLLKGSVYSKAPKAKLDSLTNAVPNFDIAAGAYMLAEGCVTYPAGTVFCCVVDPGVGTARKPIALRTKNGWCFVAPDNGLLTLIAERYGVDEVRECSNPDLWRKGTLSSTFHGRDIFGPVSGALAAGAPFEQVGVKLTGIVKLELPSSRFEDGAARGQVMRLDTYGNVVTNIRREDFEKLGIAKGENVDVSVGDDQYAAPFVSTYGDVPAGERVVVLQSAGFVELAVNLGSLADATGAALHEDVVLKKAEPSR